MTGVPSAPKATGAVLAISDRPEAASGEKPRPIRMPAVTATGVPKPAAPSKKAPKQKAISSSCMRRSSVMPESESCSTLKLPFCSVELLQEDDVEHDPADRQQAGEAAEHRRAAGHAAPACRRRRRRRAAPRSGPGPAAMCALMCRKPRATSITTTGIAASRVEITMLPNGSYTCCQIIVASPRSSGYGSFLLDSCRPVRRPVGTHDGWRERTTGVAAESCTARRRRRSC